MASSAASGVIFLHLKKKRLPESPDTKRSQLKPYSGIRHIAPFSPLTASGALRLDIKQFTSFLFLGWLGGHKIRQPLTFSIWDCPRRVGISGQLKIGSLHKKVHKNSLKNCKA